MNDHTSRPHDEQFALDELQKLSESIKLPLDTKERVRERLLSGLTPHGRTTVRTTLFMFTVRFIRPALAVILVTLISFGTAIGAVKADESKPGDPLFAIDKMIEQTQVFLTGDREKKNKLQISMAAERLQELAELAAAEGQILQKPHTAAVTNRALAQSLDEARSTIQGLHDAFITDSNSKRRIYGQVVALEAREQRLLNNLAEKIMDAEQKRGSVSSERFISICHMPEDDATTPIALRIALSAWPAHYEHGDSVGECVTLGQIIEPNRNENATSTEARNERASTTPRATSTNQDDNLNRSNTFKKNDAGIIESARKIINDLFIGPNKQQGSIKVDGVIEEKNGGIKLNGTEVHITDDTMISGKQSRDNEANDLDVGRWVDIKGEVQPDGSVNARTIRIR